MSEETEIKIALPDVADFRDRVVRLNPQIQSLAHFEDNFVLDFADGRLRSGACLVRIRKTNEGEFVTFKGPPKPSVLFKSREELETRVQDADIVLAILGKLGMRIWFRYQKYREEYSVRTGAEPRGVVTIAIDATPIGDFAELEGEEEGIREIARRLGIGEGQFLRSSYYALYEQFCRKHGRAPADMIFAGPEGSGLQDAHKRED